MIVSLPGYSLAATLRPLEPDGLNLRAGPSTSNQILGALAAWESAAVLGQEGDWIRVRTAGGLEAWVSAQYSQVSYEDEEAWAVVNTDVLNVRRVPSLSGELVTQLTQGTQVQLMEAVPDWWKIRLTDGTQGWVAAQYMLRDASQGKAPAAQPAPVPSESQPVPTPTEPQTGTAPAGQQPAQEREPVHPIEPFDRPWTPPAQTEPEVTQPGSGPTEPGSEVTEPETPPSPEPAWEAPTVPSVPTTPSVVLTVPVLPPKAPEAALPLGSKEVVATATGSVHSGRDSGLYRQVDTVQPGERLTYLGSAEGWIKVSTPRGKQGWILGSAVQIREGDFVMELDEDHWAIGHAAEPATAASVQQEEYLRVNAWDGLRLRQGAGLDSPVLDLLPDGTLLKVLNRQGAWVQVTTNSGLTGWVHSDYTIPAPAGGAVPQVTMSDSLRASLDAVSTGVLRLEVVSEVCDLGSPATEGSTVTIPCATGQAGTVLLPVKAAGATSLSVTPAGIVVTLDRPSGVQVVSQSDNRLVLELRPVLDSVEVRSEADRTVYTLSLRGTTTPSAVAKSGKVTVTIPGAMEGDLDLPAGVWVEKAASGLALVIPTTLTHTLKQTAEGYELHLYQPGLQGKTILLDPGHGGVDPGAVNRSIGVEEKAVNLAVAQRVGELLTAKGANVLITRNSDRLPAPEAVLEAETELDTTHADLEYRTRLANELGVDAFVSIHHNSGSWNAKGTETYYTDYTLNGLQSQNLAKLVQQRLVAATGLLNRGAKNYDFYVTRNTDAPAVLIELNFLSNPEEGQLAMDPAFQQKEAEAIVKALEDFYSGAAK